MRTVGIVGGLGPESTIDYYRRILGECRKRTGRDNNPNMVIASVDIVEMLGYVEKREYPQLIELLNGALRRLKGAGCDFAAISSNTPHVVFDELAATSPIELVSIVDAACAYIAKQGFQSPLLTGTFFTMRENFYGKTAARYGLNLVVPSEPDARVIHDVIFPELENGVVVPEKKARYVELVRRYVVERGIDSVILGCTELPLMIFEGDLPVPIVNTSEIHVTAIVNRILEENR